MSSDSIVHAPSNSRAPDLDWSQIRETVRMLHLAVAQIEMAMREGDDSINTLSSSFTTMIEKVNAISAASAMIDGQGEARTMIQENCATVTSGMYTSIVAFQFYDKLSQRLQHVAESLSALSGLVSDNQRLFNPGEWMGLQDHILSKYSMQEEVNMFNALLSGASIEEALQLYQVKQSDESGEHSNDIELF